MLTGETLSFVISSLYQESDLGDNLPVLLMGDFNDEPFNRSMQEYLLGTRDEERVRRARTTPRVLNLMWPLMSRARPGTFRFGSNWNMLDCFLASQGLLLNNSLVRVHRETAAIFRPEIMQSSAGRPRHFGRLSRRNLDEDGYSDHFAITVVIEG